ncbi:MAG: hypothetical protein Fur0010_01760 [Bdellovibrio sp.]
MKKLILSVLAFPALLNAVELKDTLSHRLWFLKNTGQELLQATGDITRDHVAGVPGFDVNFVEFNNISIDQSKKEVVVALIDSGVDRHHPDLKDRIWYNDKVCAPNETDHNKPCWGYNALDKTADISDDTGHGTHLAGVIAANHNSIGIAGIAHPNIKILPIKVVNNQTNGFIYNRRMITDIFADGIRYAVESGADVINMSLGWPKLIETPKMKKAVEIALEKNVPIIVAAGNNSKEIPTYPCSSKGVICVGAITNTGEIAEFSNYGGKVDFLAPGDGIVSTIPMNMESKILRIKGYDVKKGSSQAAPMVAALAATIKLEKPEITNDELYARLALSAREVVLNGEKFSKYGLIDMKSALKNQDKVFISPEFKDLLEVSVDNNGRYKFLLPIKNYLSDVEEATIDLRFEKPGFKIDESTQVLKDLKSGQEISLLVEGTIENMALDSQNYIHVTITSGEFKKSTKTMISFARELSQSDGEKYQINGLNVSKLAFIKDGRKLSLLKMVGDKYRLGKRPEYYISETIDAEKGAQSLTLLKSSDDQMVAKQLVFEGIDSILSIFKVDLNLDGQADYFVYTMNKAKTHLQFHYLDSELRPLLGDKSVWKFEITEFEGLPLKSGYLDDFKWITFSSKELGKVKIPLISKEWFVPELDNTDDILDRMPSIPDDHIYYLKPVIKDGNVTVELRIVDSYNIREKIRDQLDIPYRDSFKFEKPMSQTLEEVSKGIFRVLVSTGKEFQKRYFEIKFNNVEEYSIRSVETESNFISQNALFPILDIRNDQIFSSENLFMTLFDRTKARLFVLKESSFSRREFQTNDWSDPVFQHIATFNDDNQTTFLEGRYHVYASDSQNRSTHLSINRDSSFPGVSFSETLEPVVVQSRGKSIPAIFVNSTLIFGERLYVITMEDGEMKRPVALSVNLPRNCVRLDPLALENDLSAFGMLCVNGATQATFHYLPMSIQ